MPPDPLDNLEKGLGKVEDPDSPSSTATESSTIASCPKGGHSQSLSSNILPTVSFGN